ncbi:MAG: hypothetical protein O3A46_16845 [Candidatus Poribacteria bacterium]|nr:hypothetical protein [Candidatus Poribacteria bacterium]
MGRKTQGAPSTDAASVSSCDCDLPERAKGIEPHTARQRGFEEIEVIHFPEYRSVIYRCRRCGKRFEGWFEGEGFIFIPVLDKA